MRLVPLCLFLLAAHFVWAEEVHFQDQFKGRLAGGWSWIREDPKAWRTTGDGLEIRVLPGNMWGPPNNAKNVLVRPLPGSATGAVEVSVLVENTPTEQYEQVDLVWFYDESNMVKIGLEQVDQKLCVVMGREEKDRTRTIALLRKGTPSMGLRFRVQGDTIRGFYRPAGSDEWIKAGECTLPVQGEPKVSLQAYQGPADKERWAKISSFEIRGKKAKP